MCADEGLHDLPPTTAFEGTIFNQQTGREVPIVTELRQCGCVTWRPL